MNPLFSYPINLPAGPFKLAACDTETTRIRDDVYDSRRKTRHTPPDIPELVLGSIAYDNRVEVYHRDSLIQILGQLCRDGYHLVFHNSPFDYFVLGRYDVLLGGVLRSLVDQNRIHDTQIMEQLLQIAHGSQTVDNKVIRYVSLVDLALRRAGMSLSKDHDIRVGFDAFLDPSIPIPEEYLRYAGRDAEATYRIFSSQLKEANLYGSLPESCKYPILDNARDLFGPLSEAVQVKGSLALRWLEGFPLRVDMGRLAELRARFRAESDLFQEALLLFGWARRTRGGKFSVADKKLRAVLTDYSRGRGIVPPFSRTGLLSLTYDFWAEVIPRISPDRCRSPSGATELEEKLAVWLRHCRVRKLLSTYLDVYSTSPEHYTRYYNLGARTGRVSSTKPNIQQVPKHRDGIRSLFIPSPSCQLLEGDFKAAELIGIAQIYQMMFSGSTVGDEINAGRDPHISMAKLLVGGNWDSLTDEQRKKYRQAAKAINFGLPGGLGAAKFKDYAKRTFSVILTDEEARAFRKVALDSDPALRAYLNDGNSPEPKLRLAASNLGITFDRLITDLQAWRDENEGEPHWYLATKRLRDWQNGDDRFDLPEPPGFDKKWDLFRAPTVVATGRVRGRSIFTEAHNTPFQGLVADGAKLAAWNLFKAWHDDPFWNPVVFVHDSFLIEATPERIHEAGDILSNCMVAGLKEVCPDINVAVELIGPLERWGKDTSSEGQSLPTIQAPAPCPTGSLQAVGR